MARRQRGKLDPPAVEKWVGSDDQRVHLVADQRRERRLDLAAVARLNDADLDADLRCCRLQVSGDGLGILVLGVDQQSGAAGGGQLFTQGATLLAVHLAYLTAYAGRVAVPPGDAADHAQ